MEKSVFTPEYQVLRDQIVRARTDAGLTQRQLAQRLKVAHSWVAKVETGERRLDVVELCWVLVACEADPVPVLKTIAKACVANKRRKVEP